MNSETLIQFHFGKLNPERRADTEQNLLSDRALLEEFFSIKRDIEFAQSLKDGPRPSPRVKERLRAEFHRTHRSRWVRPLGWSAGAAMAMGLLLYFFLKSQASETPKGVWVDSPQTVSLNYL